MNALPENKKNAWQNSFRLCSLFLLPSLATRWILFFPHMFVVRYNKKKCLEAFSCYSWQFYHLFLSQSEKDSLLISTTEQLYFPSETVIVGLSKKCKYKKGDNFFFFSLLLSPSFLSYLIEHFESLITTCTLAT